jgi:hypothetical protein
VPITFHARKGRYTAQQLELAKHANLDVNGPNRFVRFRKLPARKVILPLESPQDVPHIELLGVSIAS